MAEMIDPSGTLEEPLIDIQAERQVFRSESWRTAHDLPATCPECAKGPAVFCAACVAILEPEHPRAMPTGGTFRFTTRHGQTEPLPYDSTLEDQKAAIKSARLRGEGIITTDPAQEGADFSPTFPGQGPVCVACHSVLVEGEIPGGICMGCEDGGYGRCPCCKKDYTTEGKTLCIDCEARTDQETYRSVQVRAESVLQYLGGKAEPGPELYACAVAFTGDDEGGVWPETAQNGFREDPLRDSLRANLATSILHLPNGQRFQISVEEIYNAPEGMTEYDELCIRNWAVELAEPGMVFRAIQAGLRDAYWVVESVESGDLKPEAKRFMAPLPGVQARRLMELANARGEALKVSG